GKHSVELAADHLFDELTRPSAHLALDRIKPVVKKTNSHLGCRLPRIRLRGIAHHGAVSSPTLPRRMIRGSSPRRLRHHQFLPTPLRHLTSHRPSLSSSVIVSFVLRCRNWKRRVAKRQARDGRAIPKPRLVVPTPADA